MTTTTTTDDPFADEEDSSFGLPSRVSNRFVVPPAPLTVEQAQAKRIAELKAQIESMEQSRQAQTVCTTLLQMVVSGDMAYYLSGPGQDTLGAWRNLTQDASEGMRHLAAQEREG